MARPKKSRLVPSLTTFAEELVRVLSEHVDRAVDQARASLSDELHALSREVAQLRARVPSGPPGKRGGRPRTERVCSVRGCDQPHIARGLCKNHYQQLRYAERKSASAGK
jgi:hypothetical protein